MTAMKTSRKESFYLYKRFANSLVIN